MRYTYLFNVDGIAMTGIKKINRYLDMPMHLVQNIVHESDTGSFEWKDKKVYYKKLDYLPKQIKIANNILDLDGWFKFKKHGNLVTKSRNELLVMTYGKERFTEIIDNLLGWIPEIPTKNSKFALK